MTRNGQKNTPCNFPGCHLPRDTYFVSREAFRRHLAATHMLKADEACFYIGKIIPVAYGAPRGVAKSYIITMHLLPSREKGTDYINYTDYTGHLKNKHSLDTTRVPEVYISNAS
jgi:hypothetical protein